MMIPRVEDHMTPRAEDHMTLSRGSQDSQRRITGGMFHLMNSWLGMMETLATVWSCCNSWKR